jgi:hypothetical protein
VANRVVPRTAQKSTNDLITGALWNAGPKALGDFMLNPPIFRGHQTVSVSTVSGSWDTANLDATDVDSDGGHSNTVNNSRYTAQVAGWYYAEGYFAWGSGGAASRFECAIAKNGTIVGASAQFLLYNNDIQSLMSGTLVQLAVGDYVEVWGRQNTGGNLSTFLGSDLLTCMNVFWVHS